MKNTYYPGVVMFMCLVLITSGGLSSCSSSTKIVNPVESIRLDSSDLFLVEDQKLTLIVSVIPEDADIKDVEWFSEDPTIVSVNKYGELEALKAGETRVKAISKQGGKSATCRVSVSENSLIKFEDQELKEYLLEYCDTNNDGEISVLEAFDVTALSFDSYEGDNIKGIEHFKNLISLSISKYNNKSLNEIEIADFKNLKYLSLASNHTRMEFTIVGCSKLEILSLSRILSSQLKLNNCPRLQKIYCYNSSFTEINLENCGALILLEGDKNKVDYLNLQSCSNLEWLYFSESDLKSINLKGCTNLIRTFLNRNKLKEIDFEECNQLEEIHLEENELLNSVNTKGCESLLLLNVEKCALTDINITDCIKLKRFYARENNLTQLSLKGCVDLSILASQNNKLESVDISDCNNLEHIALQNNFLTTLDVSNCKKLSLLHVFENLLETLNISNNEDLRYLSAFNNPLKTIFVYSSFDIEIPENNSVSYVIPKETVYSYK